MEPAILSELANIVLLLYLGFTYWKNYQQMKTVFGLGLMVFAGFLLAQNAFSAYFHLTTGDLYSQGAMAQAEVVNAAQTLALAVLAWVTWRS